MFPVEDTGSAIRPIPAWLACPVDHHRLSAVTGIGGWSVIADRGMPDHTGIVTWLPTFDHHPGSHVWIVEDVPMAPVMLPAVLLGLDVGKTTHYAVAVDRDGTVLADRAVPNDEMALTALLADLAPHGAVLLVVDQPSGGGALPITVAQTRGVAVGYVAGLAMRRIADTFPGRAKTDRRDARILAEAARTMPHTVRALTVPAPVRAELRALLGHDADLARSATALPNQLRGLLGELHPALERVLGPVLDRTGVLDVLAQQPTPTALAQRGQTGLAADLRAAGSRIADRLAGQIRAALAEQTVDVAGTAAAALIVPHLATQLHTVRAQRRTVEDRIAALLAGDAVAEMVRTLPGMGVRTTAVYLVETTGKTFATAAALAAYAGLVPVTWQSGTSIRGTRPGQGNRRLKAALFQAAFASLKHEPSAQYDAAKREAGKSHTQALIALARRRVDVLFAMIRDGTPYVAPEPDTPPVAA